MNKTIPASLLVPVLIIAASLTIFSIARADERGKSDANKENERGVNIQATQQIKIENNDRDEAEDIDEDNDSDREDISTSSTSTKSDKNDDEDREEGDDHRSKIADIVHKLQEIADEERGIGDDVREIALEQASTSEDAAEHMRTIESESPLKTFLFGSDFKSIGDLRSAFVTTRNHVDRLKNAADKVSDPQIKADLNVQITALEDTASSTQLFIDQHENVFSLFGWFLKIIGR